MQDCKAIQSNALRCMFADLWAYALLGKDEGTFLSAVLRRGLDDEANGEIIFPEAEELSFTFHLPFQQRVYFHWALAWILVLWQ